MPAVNGAGHLFQVGSYANFIPLNPDRIKALGELSHKGTPPPVYAELFFFSCSLEINVLFRFNDKNFVTQNVRVNSKALLQDDE